MKISVIGCGYLGAVHAACMAELGHEVVGIDVDERRINGFVSGKLPFYEPGLSELIARQLGDRLSFSTDPAEIKQTEVHFICVGTPQLSAGRGADLSYVNQAVDTVLEQAQPGSLIAGKSTVPVGTAESLAERVRSGRIGSLTITKIDGLDALSAAGPVVDALTAAGFTMTPRGLRMRSGAR